MCLKDIEKIVMAPIKATQKAIKDIGRPFGLTGPSNKNNGSTTATTPEITQAAQAASDEAERLRQIAVDRQKAAETALATDEEKKRQTEMTANVTGIPLSESLLQRKAKRGGTGRRSLISGSSGGLGFFSRFS